MVKRCQRWLTLGLGSLLFLPASPLFADVTSPGFFTPPYKDKSIEYLGRIFGNVPGVLTGEAGPLLAHMFGVFNSIALSVALFIMGYLLLVGTIRTAAEGEFLGKQWSSLWIPFRSIGGVALLVPIKTASEVKGYCIIQALIMWLIVQGVGGADHIWNTALDYIDSGAPLVTYTQPSNRDTHAAKVILNSLVCMYAMRENMHPELLDFAGSYYRTASFDDNIYNLPWSPTHPKYPITSRAYNAAMAQTDKEYFVYFGDGCGAASWPNSELLYHHDADNPAPKAGTPEALKEAVNIGIAKAQNTLVPVMINTLSPLAWAIVHRKVQYEYTQGNSTVISDVCPEDKKPCNEIATPLPENTMVMAVRAYQRGINSVKSEIIATNSGSDELANLKKMAKEEGWISAGTYYQSIAKHTQMKTDSEHAGWAPTVYELDYDSDAFKARWNFPLDLYANITQKIKEAKKYSDKHGKLNKGAYGEFALPVPGFLSDFKAVRDLAADISDALQPLAQFVKKQITAQENPKTDPLITTQAFGYLLLIAAIVILFAAVIGGGGLGWLLSICGNWTGGGYAVTAVATLIAPIFGVIWAALFTAASTMAFYVPLVPFVLFLFGSMAWLMFCIESMVAAPLMALGVMHPEGHDALGKAEPSLMLLLNLFLRPSLMIIGLLAAMLLSFVVTGMFNTMFFSLIWAVMTGPMSGFLIGLMEITGLTLVYVTLLLMIIPRVFSLIYEIPNKVDRWIGGMGGGDTLSEKAGGEVKSAHDQSTAAMKGAGQGVHDKAVGSASRAHQDYKARDKGKGSGTTGQNTSGESE